MLIMFDFQQVRMSAIKCWIIAFEGIVVVREPGNAWLIKLNVWAKLFIMWIYYIYTDKIPGSFL